MLSNLKNIFKVPDLRNKILFMLAMIALYRLGVAIRVPASTPIAVKQFKEAAKTQGALGFLNLFSGGALRAASRSSRSGSCRTSRPASSCRSSAWSSPSWRSSSRRARSASARSPSTPATWRIGIATLQATGADVHLRHRAAAPRSSRPPAQAPTVKLLPDGMWPRGYLIIPTLVAGTAAADVDRRADQPARHRQRHEMIIFASVVSQPAVRLLLDHRRSTSGSGSSLIVALTLGDHRRRRARRARPTAHPRAVRQTRGRPAHVRRPEHLHPAEGQPDRRHPDHLRQLGAAAAGAHLQRPRAAATRAGGASSPSSSTSTSSTARTSSTSRCSRC